MKRPQILFVTTFNFCCLPPHGGGKKKMLNNGLILTGKKYVVLIYKIKLHTKNHVDWIKNEVPREV